ncbi:hypothetical protein DPEC_G00165930 [Dallia pectoralis]|uniref:Uncharacterized protein n=1 Tax=Dallia pectoralis TaxID=75939 RepID=A0ACC2GHG2_DALPE|nr:hypothetical protein DPEC_G00165930 [Dallia pectoralis]
MPMMPVPQPTYSQARENLVMAIPPKIICLLACGGRDCRYEGSAFWRPSVLIACYLVYSWRVSPSEAVQYVRIKRPRFIQTRDQISLVFDFARLLGTQLAQYPDLSNHTGLSSPCCSTCTARPSSSTIRRLVPSGGSYPQEARTLRRLVPSGGSYPQEARTLRRLVPSGGSYPQEARTLRHTPKVVYLLCGRFTSLPLDMPASPEVHAELKRRAELRALGRTVRDTLVAKQSLPLLQDGPESMPVASWDEPEGFLDRKRQVLLDKRSYSDSDICKITVTQTGLSCSSSCQGDGRTKPTWRDCATEIITVADVEKLISGPQPRNHLNFRTPCPQEEMENYAALVRILKSSIRPTTATTTQHPAQEEMNN